MPTAAMKIYLSASDPSVRVPFREVTLSTGERIPLYDTSGPYTDPSFTADVKQGLPPLRRVKMAAAPFAPNIWCRYSIRLPRVTFSSRPAT